MTGGTAWHARVECGSEVGAGFLVSGRHVLTCAHVVRRRESSPVVVSFPADRELTGIPATVTVHGGWQGGPTDQGDLAVLDLGREVPLQPAEFAAPWEHQGNNELIAYGFPRGYDEGMLASYRALPGPLIYGEWAQLEATTAHGQPLAPGFSGAAAALADGRVVGMVSTVAGGKDVRVGRMLPTQVMVRYWPELCELMPASGHPPQTVRRLNVLVRRAAAEGLDCSPDRLYVDAVGPFGPPLPEGGFTSLGAAAGYVMGEVPDTDAVTRFADRLGDLLDAPPAPRAVAPGWSPILVEIEHSGAGADQVTVEVSACRDGHRRRVDSRRIPRSAVREFVQQRIDAAFDHLAPDAQELLAFVLPREWLNEPVAHWECGPEDSTPLGCAHPLVVMDRSRHRSGRLRHQLTKTWQQLEARPAAPLHRVDCGGRERPAGLRKRLRDEDVGLAGFSYPPHAARPNFEAGLNTPVPVLLWPRTGCTTPGHDGPCAGTTFLDELTDGVAGVPPAELPRHVMNMRETAEADDDPDRHWAKDVQLLWDDPRCFPQPAASLHSPVR